MRSGAMLRVRSRVIGLSVAALLVLSAAYATPATPASRPASQLTTILEFEPGTLDPAVATDAAAKNLIKNMYEPLIDQLGTDLTPKPALATGWKISPDGTTYTFSLRKGVKFQDGTSFDAEAVKFSFERIQKLNQGPAWMLRILKKVEVVDSHTVNLTIEEPFAPFLHTLTFMFIVSPTCVKAREVAGDLAAKWMQNNVCGTGPYKLEAWEPGQKLTLVKNEGYWRGWRGKRIERITGLVVRERATARLMLEKDQADILHRVGIDDIRAYQRNPNLKVHEDTTLNLNFVMFNNEKGITKDRRIRQAMAYAFDYTAYIKGIMQGHAAEATAVFVPELIGGCPDLKVYRRDLERAKSLLREAGYPNGGFAIESYFITGLTEEQKLLELLQANLAELNITLEINTLTWPVLLAALQKKETAKQAYAWYLWPNYPDPDAYFYMVFHTGSQGTTGRNLMYYSNAEVDNLVIKARKSQDSRERRALYCKINNTIMEDSPGIVVNRAKYQIVMNARLKGYAFNAMWQGFVRFHDMEWD